MTSSDYLIQGMLLAIAEKLKTNEGYIPYGTDYENTVFVIRQQCWDDHDLSIEGDEISQDACEKCNKPNFLYKPTGFEVTWRDFIGNNMNENQILAPVEIANMLISCIESIKN